MSHLEIDATSQQADGTSKQVVLPAQLSPERSRKFELLVHLLTDLSQALVVCGPEGIGKTAALRFLESQADEKMVVCFLESSGDLDFGAIQVQLHAALGGTDQGDIESSLIGQLVQMEKSRRILVLLLDDAGQLAPTVLTTICRFAIAYPALRPVFAMTSDDLQIKCSTDPVIDNCHIVEIPPLSEEQCGEYLKNLSGKPGGMIRFAAITPAMVQKVYRTTHGIPGRIISLLPKINKMKVESVTPKIIPIESVLLGVAIVAGALFWFFSSQDGAEPSGTKIGTALSSQQRMSVKLPAPADSAAVVDGQVKAAVNAERALPGDSTQEKGVENVVVDRLAAADKNGPPEDAPVSEGAAEESVVADNKTEEPVASVEADVLKKEAEARSEEVLPKEGKLETVSIAGVKDAKSLLAKNPDRYTLQLLAVREREALERFVKKHPELRGLSFFEFKRNGVTWHALLYGDYPSLKAAKRAAKRLPKSFRTPWPRKLSSIQNLIRPSSD
jgi:DamX protein